MQIRPRREREALDTTHHDRSNAAAHHDDRIATLQLIRGYAAMQHY
jgi:hypothetical protein